MKKAIDFLNPWRKPGMDAGHWLLTIGLVVALLVASFAGGYGIGFHNGEKYGASFFEQKYSHLGIKTQHLKSRYMLPTATKTFPSLLSVNIAHYPAAGDQGAQGSCAAFASAWVLSYDYRMAHLTPPNAHPGIKFSPAWLYTHYSDAYSNGQDAGSWPQQDLELVPTLGVPQFSVYPSPRPIVDPFPTSGAIPAVYANAAKYKIPVSATTLYQGYPSDAIFGEIQTVLSQGQPALLSINVPPSFDNATVTHGLVSYPGPETSRGGHEIVAIAVDSTKVMPDGSVGAVEVQNQWTRAWGINGRAWLSREWLANEAWAVVEENVAPGSPTAHFFKPPKGADGGNKISPPPPFLSHPKAQKGKRLNAVKGIFARDLLNVDLSPAINNAAHKYGLSAVGLAATILSECGGNTHDPTCFREYGYCCGDWSYGACQVTISTAHGYGVGDGTQNSAGHVDSFESNASRCIFLAARVLADDRRIAGVNFPQLAVAWNAGPYQQRDFLFYPTGQAYANHQAWLQWQAYAKHFQKVAKA